MPSFACSLAYGSLGVAVRSFTDLRGVLLLRSKVKALVPFAVIVLLSSGLFAIPVFADDFGSENADGIVEVSTSGAVSPEYDALTDSYANSWRYIDGIPGDDGIALFSGGKNSWSKQGGSWICSNGMRVDGAKAFGVDVSQWQGNIDWAAAKADGVEYAIIRCGWGSDYTSQDDPFFIKNVKGCLNNGIKIGIYLYSYGYNESHAKSEANHVLRLLSQAGLNPSMVDLPIYYDLENEAGTGRPCGQSDGKKVPISNDMLARMARVFCDTLSNAGYKPGVYANLNWWNNYLTDGVFSNWSKWVAQYNTSCSYSGQFDIWQCMSSGNVKGINGNVDINFDFSGISQESSVPNAVAMYRLYNPNSGEHFYTSSLAERNNVVKAGWNYEGIAWYAPLEGSPVYRLYNPNAGDHHYTTSVRERDEVIAAGWKYEGISWYSASTDSVPLYRVYNPNARTGTHHYTVSAGERDHLVRLGWRNEGIGWYGLS